MILDRFFVSLALLAIGLLLTALIVSGGASGATVLRVLGAISYALPAFTWPSGLIARIWPSDAVSFFLGLAAGWGLRWLYCLPWAAIPRAVTEWFSTLHVSAAMVVMVLGCTAILVLL
jgi:hypothetical protein